MKDYKRYIIAVGLLTVSFLYIFTSNETGVARIFVNLLTFAGIYGLAAIGIKRTFWMDWFIELWDMQHLWV